jgi:segregation and condensation protein A
MNNTTLNLKLNVFKGSLDILIALIHEHKMDILNLDIAQLAEQYLIYIQQNINNITIDAACEYLSMSTYLIELKSKKILPSENLVDGQNNFEYERDKLIKRIIEYNEYKKAANKLIVKQDQRLMMYAKPASDLDEYVNDEVIKAKLPESIDSNKLFKAMEVAIEK